MFWEPFPLGILGTFINIFRKYILRTSIYYSIISGPSPAKYTINIKRTIIRSINKFKCMRDAPIYRIVFYPTRYIHLSGSMNTFRPPPMENMVGMYSITTRRPGILMPIIFCYVNLACKASIVLRISAPEPP